MGEDRYLGTLGTPLAGAGEDLAATRPVLGLPRRSLDLSRRVAIMGIVNNTPDSFYDQGSTFGATQAAEHARRLISEGADIIDIGGIKGGPGSSVSVKEELERVVPVVEMIRAFDDQVLLSVDTFRAPVAEAVLAAGADIVNDVTGAWDPEILPATAAGHGGYVAMHHGGEPRTRPFRRGFSPDITTAVVEHCGELAQRAIDAGIDRTRVIVDPGHDFQKTTYHSLELSRRLPELTALGFPVLVALSNKDFVGETLDRPIGERVDGSLAATVFSILRGAHIVRVHEVERTRDVVEMTEALLGWRDPRVTIRGLE